MKWNVSWDLNFGNDENSILGIKRTSVLEIENHICKFDCLYSFQVIYSGKLRFQQGEVNTFHAAQS